MLFVNYCSGIGYGFDFCEVFNYGVFGVLEFNDVLGVGFYLVGWDDVDVDCIGFWGGLYGGYFMVLGLVWVFDFFVVGVDIYGVYDWNCMIKNFVLSYELFEDFEGVCFVFELLLFVSVDIWMLLVLLIYGDDDCNVFFEEMVEFVDCLCECDVEYDFVIFFDEVYGFLLYFSWLEVFGCVVEFFEKYFGVVV